MKILWGSSVRRAAGLLAGASFVSLAGLSPAHAADTVNIEVWYALNSHNAEVFKGLVKDFNRDQGDVRVSATGFDDQQAIEAALADSGKKKGPDLVQLRDDRSPDGSPGNRKILPLHTLLGKYPLKDAKWFLPSTNTFARDTKGRLTGFPYMASVPVMFYNTDAFKSAGVKPKVPEDTWHGLQGQLLQLANAGRQKCPLAVGAPVTVDLESLAAVNKQYYVSGENGLKARGKPSFNFDLLYVRHMSLMNSWASSGILARPMSDAQAVERFAKRQCAILMSESDSIGAFNDTWRLDFGVSGLPHYAEATKSPGVPFVGGSALWVMSGHSAKENKAAASFLGWLARPENAAKWYQSTGYLPLTRQAFSATDAGYYKKLGTWRDIVASYASRPEDTSRGFRVKNYPQVRAMLRDALDDTLNGEKPAVPVLKSAASQAEKIARAH